MHEWPASILGGKDAGRCTRDKPGRWRGPSGTRISTRHPNPLKGSRTCSKCLPNPGASPSSAPPPARTSWATKSSTTSSSTATKGGIYPVNPTAPEILGLKAYPVGARMPRPGRPGRDPGAEQGRARRHGAVRPARPEGRRRSSPPASARSAPPGKALEQQVIEIAKRYGMRMVGPNVLGIIDTVRKLNASFAAGMPRRGQIAFMSQSGALCTSILDMAHGPGHRLLPLLQHRQQGRHQRAGPGDGLGRGPRDPRHHGATWKASPTARSSSASAREVTRHKPIIAIKSGTTSAGSKAVSSHTGTLAGSEAAYDAAFKQCGIIRAGSVQDLFDYRPGVRPPAPARRRRVSPSSPTPAAPASWPPTPSSMRGCAWPRSPPRPSRRSRRKLPAAASVANPIDVLGDAPADRYALAIEAALTDPNVRCASWWC